MLKIDYDCGCGPPNTRFLKEMFLKFGGLVLKWWFMWRGSKPLFVVILEAAMLCHVVMSTKSHVPYISVVTERPRHYSQMRQFLSLFTFSAEICAFQLCSGTAPSYCFLATSLKNFLLLKYELLLQTPATNAAPKTISITASASKSCQVNTLCRKTSAIYQERRRRGKLKSVFSSL